MAYFANASEGETLDYQCSNCPLGQEHCPIFLVQMMHNYDQVGNPKLEAAMNLLVDKKGNCQLKPLLIAEQALKDPLKWIDEP